MNKDIVNIIYKYAFPRYVYLVEIYGYIWLGACYQLVEKKCFNSFFDTQNGIEEILVKFLEGREYKMLNKNEPIELVVGVLPGSYIKLNDVSSINDYISLTYEITKSNKINEYTKLEVRITKMKVN